MKFGVEDNIVYSSSYDSFKETHLISEVILNLENSKSTTSFPYCTAIVPRTVP